MTTSGRREILGLLTEATAPTSTDRIAQCLAHGLLRVERTLRRLEKRRLVLRVPTSQGQDQWALTPTGLVLAVKLMR
mgnify:CR=1 FL=1